MISRGFKFDDLLGTWAEARRAAMTEAMKNFLQAFPGASEPSDSEVVTVESTPSDGNPFLEMWQEPSRSYIIGFDPAPGPAMFSFSFHMICDKCEKESRFIIIDIKQDQELSCECGRVYQYKFAEADGILDVGFCREFPSVDEPVWTVDQRSDSAKI